jgi:hypothetical protein
MPIGVRFSGGIGFRLNFNIFIEVSVGTAERTRKSGVVRFEERADALVVEGVGAWCDEKCLADSNAE